MVSDLQVNYTTVQEILGQSWLKLEELEAVQRRGTCKIKTVKVYTLICILSVIAIYVYSWVSKNRLIHSGNITMHNASRIDFYSCLVY